MGHPSPAQKVVRKIFRASCDCFNAQPDAGGAVPPAIGPRNKSWWHTDSLAFPWRYYNYFMHKTLKSYLADTTPDWCIEKIVQDTYVISTKPNTNVGGLGYFYLTLQQSTGRTTRAIFRASTPKPIYYLSVLISLANFVNIAPRKIGCYALAPPDWNEMTATWNNQPTWGALLDEKVIDGGGRSKFNAQGNYSVGLKFIDEGSLPGLSLIDIKGYTSEAALEAHKPRGIY